MIPEESFHFNHLSASSHFDDHRVRLRHLLQQNTPPALETGRHLLFVCPVCKHPWYKAGRHEYPRLTPEQLASLGAALRVDTQALYLLPRALCTICSTLHLGGVLSAEIYPHDSGYRLRWESASPRRIQLLAMIYRSQGKGLTLDTLVQMAPVTFVEPAGEARALLSWLESCPLPDTSQAFTAEQCQRLARCCPPGSALDGRACQWRGYAWQATCAPLGSAVLVGLAVALATPALPPFSSLRLGWRVLAQAMRAVL